MIRSVVRSKVCMIRGHEHAPIYMIDPKTFVIPMYCERCGRNTGRTVEVTADMVGKRFHWAPRGDRPWG